MSFKPGSTCGNCHQSTKSVYDPDAEDIQFLFDPKPCVPVCLPAECIEKTVIPIHPSRLRSESGQRFVCVSLARTLHWCANQSGAPVSIAQVEAYMADYGLSETSIFAEPFIFRHSHFEVRHDDEKLVRLATMTSADLIGAFHDPDRYGAPTGLFVRFPALLAGDGFSVSLFEALNWGAKSWKSVEPTIATERQALLGTAKDLRIPIERHWDGTILIPRISILQWHAMSRFFASDSHCDRDMSAS